MIIPSNTPKSPLFKPVNRPDPEANPPPSYHQSDSPQALSGQAGQNTVAQPQITSSSFRQHETDPLLGAELGGAKPPRPQSARKRFFLALFWAGAILLVLSLSLKFASVHGNNVEYDWFHKDSYTFPQGIKKEHIRHCATWNNWTPGSAPDLQNYTATTYSALRTVARIPFSPEALYIGASGFVHGSLGISTHPVLEDAMQVDVQLINGGNDIHLCAVQNKEKNGIVLLAPLTFRRQPLVNIDVFLPQETNSILSGLDINMRNYDIKMKDIEQLQFGNVSIRTTGMNIVIDTLSAVSASVKTSEGSIKGSFSTTGNLEIRTSAGPIDVSVALEHDPNTNTTPSVKMATTKREIVSRVALVGPPDSSFNVDARTSRNLIDYHVHSQPLDSKLFLTGRTTAGTINAELPPSFEGNFKLEAFCNKPVQHKVRIKEDVVDPGRQGRERKYDINTYDYGSTAFGSVYWGSEKKGGLVSLSTTDRPISFTV